jgi:DNA recombination protein RmuC
MIAGWFATQDINSLLTGFLAGLLIAVLASWAAYRRGSGSVRDELGKELRQLRSELESGQQALVEAERELAVVQTRLEEQQTHFKAEKDALAESEKRLTESFERLSGKIFDERSKRFTEVSEKQVSGLLKPLSKDLESFRKRVDETHSEDIRQHAALQEKLKQLEGLNEKLNEEARNLTRALTSDVKAQGSWGEHQLEKLLEISGLKKGENYHTQYSVTGQDGKRLQPDLVLLLPEGRTIVMDSKVSLTAWTRYQAATDEAEREVQLAAHVRSIRAHIDNLAGKNYAGVEDLNALDFVLMFMPIEAALITALQQDPTLPEYALKNRIALLSPANFLATVRTVASVWLVHKQNTNAQDIAARAGFLYDKFVGFTDNLKQVGARMDQARKSYDDALSQLSSGAGNLVGQAEKLRTLGAKHAKQLDQALVDASETESIDTPSLRVVESDEDSAESGES